jgi:hypothetical protein
MLRGFTQSVEIAMFDSGPLFYRKKVDVNGESEELSLGRSVVSVFRWLGILILLAAWVFCDKLDPLSAIKALIKLIP